MNDDDDNSRLGMWIGIGTALLIAIGTVLILAWSSLDDETATAAAAPKTAPVVATASTAVAPVADADAVMDLPLTGELLGSIFFDTGKTDIAAASNATFDKAVAAIGTGARKVVLSGFHDLSGNPTQNAELAKNRAKAVRERLKAKGVAAERIVLRKPAETGVGGPAEEARRVEIRLVD